MIAVDWGTSSFRAFRLDAAGVVRARHVAPRGILTVEAGGFAAVLRQEIESWLVDGEHRVLLSGMVGSRQGWVEAPYLACPAGAAELARALVAIPFDGAELRLVPGLSDQDDAGTPEVMRGEETQLVGVLDRIVPEGLACLPGSHSKWARIGAGGIAGFHTYLSGEAFAALRDGTILGRMMDRMGPIGISGFDLGLARAGEQGHLLHQLFGVRTLGLVGRLTDADSAGYLSGLLIGHEVRAAMPTGAHVHLIGAAPLCVLYARAIAAAGGVAVILDEDAAALGLARIGELARWS